MAFDSGTGTGVHMALAPMTTRLQLQVVTVVGLMTALAADPSPRSGGASLRLPAGPVTVMSGPRSPVSEARFTALTATDDPLRSGPCGPRLVSGAGL